MSEGNEYVVLRCRGENVEFRERARVINTFTIVARVPPRSGTLNYPLIERIPTYTIINQVGSRRLVFRREKNSKYLDSSNSRPHDPNQGWTVIVYLPTGPQTATRLSFSNRDACGVLSWSTRVD